MGVGHTYSHVNSSIEESSEGSIGTRKADSPAVKKRPYHSLSGSESSDVCMEDSCQDVEDIHSSGGDSDPESNVEVSSSSGEDNVLEMYFADDGASDSMDVDEYL